MAHPWNARLYGIPLIALVCAACVTARGETPPDGEVVGQQLLEYQLECSEVRPREALLRLRWPASARARDARIEISPYKDGFTTGRFVSATVSDLRAVPPPGVLLQAPDTARAAAALPGTVALRLESLGRVKAGTQIETVVSGLIPGVNYYVRVLGVPGTTIRVRAPICPVDYVDQP